MPTATRRGRPKSRKPLTNKILTPARRRTRDELYALGKSLRDKHPRTSHAAWKAPHQRPDPVRLVEQANQGRIPELIPIRHGRMLVSPFTYYRGTALNMAADLSFLPTTGVRVQACGDAHLGNFRCFATPERHIIFDIHDLDETLPAPWEWDVKRLAASFVVASRNNGLSEKNAEDAVLTCVRSYRERMAEFSTMRAVDVWYAHFEADDLIKGIRNAEVRSRARKGLTKAVDRAKLEDVFPELDHSAVGVPTIREDRPTIYHWDEHGTDDFSDRIRDGFAAYRHSLSHDKRVLLDRFVLKDIAIKVVGVGSVGTVCGVILLMGAEKDHLFLQLKEARASVLEAYAGKSDCANHGERVVVGHRLMQSASDVFLGFLESKVGRHYYVRQLRDVKIKFAVEQFGSAEMPQFAEWCGATLARAHARSGEPAVISGYLGKSDTFDAAIAAFSLAYADQNERDFEALKKAAGAGRIEVVIERS